MSQPALILRHLCFTGQEKPLAYIEFREGLNLLYGASDTGKSFILEAIDFMLGGGAALRDIPERVGYDSVVLACSLLEGDGYTLVRGIGGGEYALYTGIHKMPPSDQTPRILKGQHEAKNDANISTFLLQLIGLDKKRVKKNAKGVTNNLTFRNLAPLCIISEADIQKRGSPILSGQFTSATAEYSTFKLLLTGVDDSSIVNAARNVAVSQSREGKIEVIDELLASYLARFAVATENASDDEDFLEQLDKLNLSIEGLKATLQDSQASYDVLAQRRNEIRLTLENSLERRNEITELLARFELLDQHYKSDIERLEGIREAGSLVSALSPGSCPLCGAKPEDQHADTGCDADFETVVLAATSELNKISKLSAELKSTVIQLRQEFASFNGLIPRTRTDLAELNQQIARYSPAVNEQRASFQELVEKRAVYLNAIQLLEQINKLRRQRAELEEVAEPSGENPSQVVTDLSASVLFAFSQVIEGILKHWHFPNGQNVHFDPAEKDIVISGKPRSSRGKGMRAVTHAAFTLALTEFCRNSQKPHPGFVVMDSPLLAYREPEPGEDDLSVTNLKEHFFDYLQTWKERQIIIIENVDPPDALKAASFTTFFSGTTKGRAGFFPVAG